MSIIVAVKGEGCVYLAADSQATTGESKLILDPKHGKLRQLTPQLTVGCTGNMNQLDVLYRFPIIDTEVLQNVSDCALYIWNKIANTLTNDSLMEKNRDTGAAELPGRLLIAWKDDFIEVDAGGQLIKPAGPWHAIGSGADVARGSLHRCEEVIAAAEGKIVTMVEICARQAIEAACTFNIYCSLPVITAVTRV